MQLNTTKYFMVSDHILYNSKGLEIFFKESPNNFYSETIMKDIL